MTELRVSDFVSGARIKTRCGLALYNQDRGVHPFVVIGEDPLYERRRSTGIPAGSRGVVTSAQECGYVYARFDAFPTEEPVNLWTGLIEVLSPLEALAEMANES